MSGRCFIARKSKLRKIKKRFYEKRGPKIKLLYEKIKRNHFLYVLIILIFLSLLFSKSIIFGSQKGGWVYPYINYFNITLIFIFILIVPFILILLKISYKYLQHHELKIIGLWFLIGFISQIAIFSLYPVDIGEIIESDVCTSFYSPTQKYSAQTLIKDYNNISKTLPFHAQSNMPGKILFFYFLELFSSSSEIIGYLLVFFSCLGSFLVYFISKALFRDKLIALYSLILYLFIPARIFFSPSLNSVSPIFILLSFLFLLQYIESKKMPYLLFLGLSLYVVLIFEPLLFVLGIMFVAIILINYLKKKISKSDIVKIIVVSLFAFFLSHLLMLFMFNYNAIDNFILLLKDAADFNVHANRTYIIWIFQNLKNFFINAGVVQSVVFLSFLMVIFGKLFSIIKEKSKNIPKKINKHILDPGVFIALAFSLNLIIVDLIGITRGEIIRLWIFLTVFVQITVAYVCVKKLDKLSFKIILLSSILQILVTIRMVGFLLC